MAAANALSFVQGASSSLLCPAVRCHVVFHSLDLPFQSDKAAYLFNNELLGRENACIHSRRAMKSRYADQRSRHLRLGPAPRLACAHHQSLRSVRRVRCDRCLAALGSMERWLMSDVLCRASSGGGDGGAGGAPPVSAAGGAGRSVQAARTTQRDERGGRRRALRGDARPVSAESANDRLAIESETSGRAGLLSLRGRRRAGFIVQGEAVNLEGFLSLVYVGRAHIRAASSKLPIQRCRESACCVCCALTCLYPCSV